MSFRVLPNLTKENPPKERIMELVRMGGYSFCFIGILMHLIEYDNVFSQESRNEQAGIAVIFFALLLFVLQRVKLINIPSLVVTIVYGVIAFFGTRIYLYVPAVLPGQILARISDWILLMVVTDMFYTKRIRRLKRANLWMFGLLALAIVLMQVMYPNTEMRAYLVFFVLCLIPTDIYDIDIYGNYALVSLMSAGSFVYDISDPGKPVLLRNINAVVGEESKLFRKLNPETNVMTYDYTKETHGSMIHSFLYRGELYCVSADMGVVKTPLLPRMDANLTCLARAKGSMPGGNAGLPEVTGETKEVQLSGGSGSSTGIIMSGFGGVNALAELPDGNLIAACGSDGLKVLDRDCKVLNQYGPDDLENTDSDGTNLASDGTGVAPNGFPRGFSGYRTCKDVKVFGDYVYVAEGYAGFTIYRYDSATLTLTETGRLEDASYNAYISSVTALDDGSLAILQAGAGGGRYLLVDCRNKENPPVLKNPAAEGVGSQFHRNLGYGMVGEFIAVTGTRINWFRWLKDGEINDLPADGSRGKQEILVSFIVRMNPNLQPVSGPV